MPALLPPPSRKCRLDFSLFEKAPSPSERDARLQPRTDEHGMSVENPPSGRFRVLTAGFKTRTPE